MSPPSVLLTQCRRQLSHNHGLALRFTKRTLATVVDAPKTHRLAVSILLNRSPILTRTPTKFEREFYKYQQRIQRTLHNPFPHEFYFKQGSLLEAQFNQDEIRRERKAFGKDAVKDMEDKSSLLMNVESTTGEEEEQPLPRRTAADEKRDLKSLDRHGARNLYLLVKGLPGDKYQWRFPKGHVETGELLHEAAKRDLHAECGPHMNTWIVGRKPIGLFEYQYQSNADPQFSCEKIFFYKAHIFAGQARPVDKKIADFAWLTKEEIESYVDKEYWLGTKDMLSDV
ncbi:uncharacterized protein FOMMEDRAFT_157304 [Fomitiporia mediterranea MF3/22]|uniref:uncharacterized protein n=1 Tax=Fomitiporia mediterranea (strain MF3/22) TaxID=694068 RepID=UPI0004408D95|nr:uncharacterized protein FOMMEDRAFT_157304 [Fomitiporia mediterranea MF3/22]EJD02110.1 hypothetical protein FOMMEDRAFT_157304 [Fomitiporia mediterranea MF3/22]